MTHSNTFSVQIKQNVFCYYCSNTQKIFSKHQLSRGHSSRLWGGSNSQETQEFGSQEAYGLVERDNKYISKQANEMISSKHNAVKNKIDRDIALKYSS